MKNKQPTQEQQSRSVQRRIAAQKGKPAPDFSKPMTEEKLRKQIAKRIREGLIRDFNKLYVKEFTTTWQIERVCRGTEIDIMSLDNTVDRILSLIKQPEVIDMLARKAGYTQLDADQQTPQYNNDFLSQF
nr:hypothetical protein [Candidatus Bipolaricaulis sp.]